MKQAALVLCLTLAGGLAAARLLSVQEPASSRAEDLKFSHRLHLSLAGVTCADCHTRAAASTEAADNNLPREKDCLKCHDGRQARGECAVCHRDPQRAKPLQVAGRPFRFSHPQHLELGNIAPLLATAIEAGSYLGRTDNLLKKLETENSCVACHRGLDETDFSHAGNLPQMADCLVCHDEINLPFSCEFCHTKEARLKPASHTPDFLDLHSRKDFKFEKSSCTICHGTNFRCLGCH